MASPRLHWDLSPFPLYHMTLSPGQSADAVSGDRRSAQWCISQLPDSSNLRALRALRALRMDRIDRKPTENPQNAQTKCQVEENRGFEGNPRGALSSLPTVPSLLHRSFVLRRLFCIILGQTHKCRCNQMQSETWLEMVRVLDLCDFNCA